jgi:curved DNA-binding protein CbpA
MVGPPERTHYAVLGLTPDATDKEIKDAYRRAARASHPDRGGDPGAFHTVAVAYETLADPERRRRYDRRIRRTAPDAAPSRDTPPAPRAQAPDTGRLPEYVPAFSPSQPPVIPLAVAGRQVHGEPRRPGPLARFARFGRNAQAQYDGETLTVRALERQFLADFPAARLVSGLRFARPAHAGAGHALLAGYRLAVLDSLAVPAGNYHWDGRTLRYHGKAVSRPDTETAARAVQELIPECNVRPWLILHSPGDNPFEPVIDYPPSRGGSAVAGLRVLNRGSALRELRTFLADGPQPNAVQLPVLARLLEAAGR